MDSRPDCNQAIVAGVDEAGRGPLAGPVVAAAVVLSPKHPIAGLKDSKQLTANQRGHLYLLIQKQAMAYAFGQSSVEEIDRLNILQASLLAMQRAIEALPCSPHHVLVDGLHTPDMSIPMTALVKGDCRKHCIAAASILAKVSRDQQMYRLHQDFPQYGFAQHKGYPTKQHIQALTRHGPTQHHRRTFATVRQMLLAITD